jgi:hypothetical protein
MTPDHDIPRPLRPLLTVILLGVLAAPVQAGIPYPHCTYYGEVRDAYGYNYQSGYVIGRVNGEELDHAAISSNLGPSMNYRLEIPVSATRLDGYAMTGDKVHITILQDDGTELAVIDEDELPVIGSPGETIHLDLALGTDSDDDGLPDEWEQWLILNSAGSLSDVSEILPGDDFDGDGSSNQDEFNAGTDAAYVYDYLRIESLRPAADGWWELSFYTVSGRTYWLQRNQPLDADHAFTWAVEPFKLSLGQDDFRHYLNNAGGLTHLLVPAFGQASLFRVNVE